MNTIPQLLAMLTISALMCNACRPSEQPSDSTPAQPDRPAYALVLHGGAGVISRDIHPEVRDGYLASLEQALSIGVELLENGAGSVQTIEAVIRHLEDDERFNAGRGSVFTNEGRHELDASIMDGRDLNAGAVAGVQTVKNPISLARMVMEESRHVMFAAGGAERFADEMNVERVDNSYFATELRREQWQRAQQAADSYSTVGAVALDREGNLAAGTSTGGMTNKMPGRVGDSPIIAAGTYADNTTCAVSATGHGELFMRNAVAYQIAAAMEYGGLDLQEAARRVIHEKLSEGDGGIIAVDRHGNIVMEFSTPGMFRGAAAAHGRFEVAIWD